MRIECGTAALPRLDTDGAGERKIHIKGPKRAVHLARDCADHGRRGDFVGAYFPV